MPEKIVFCKGGGCTAKLGPGALSSVLEKLPRPDDPNLLVGFQSSDDAAVYRLTDDLAVVMTLDFFPPMVEDPFLFGQIAAANALSDIYAMGADVKTALNIVCFPDTWDLNILGRILEGGLDKVNEAGGVLAGGHSIRDTEVKYGLSVTGTIHPDRIYANCGGNPGDILILTKPLGVGIVCAASRVGKASDKALSEAVGSMTTINKYASEAMRKYRVHACTDVTGFGFLGHLKEMLRDGCGADVDTLTVPFIREAAVYAREFIITAAAERNREYLQKYTEFMDVPFSMQELLFDPQTSGGLLIAVDPGDADALLSDIEALGLPCGIVGSFIQSPEKKILIR